MTKEFDTFDALALGVLADGQPRTLEQIQEEIEKLTDEQRLDIIAKYQEYDPNP